MPGAADERRAALRHDAANALAVARANLEAMVDGIFEPEPERLRAVLAALERVSGYLESLRPGAPPQNEKDLGRRIR